MPPGADYFSANILVAQVGKRIGGILSAKAGEGMLSGMCTARLRLVAMEARRPLPFAEENWAFISRLGREIIKSNKKPVKTDHLWRVVAKMR